MRVKIFLFLLRPLFATLPAIKLDLAPETVHGEQQDYSEKNSLYKRLYQTAGKEKSGLE